MTTCKYCNILKGESKAENIYEDPKMLAILSPTPAVLGHIILFPKKHYAIIEQIPDYEIAELFKAANKLSSAVFEALQPKGTNIIIQNGLAAGQTDVPHVGIHIIPRNDNDGINFQWQPKQLTEEQMSTVELKLKEASRGIGNFQKEEKKEPVKIETKAKEIKESKKGENYLLKQLNRIP